MEHLGRIALVCLLALATRGLEAADGTKVVMRTSSGRYLRTDPDGSLRAQRWFPTEEETFQLVARDAGGVSLKDFRGRWLLLAGPAGRTLRAAAAPAGQPLLVSETGEGQATLQVPGAGRPLSFDIGPAPKSEAKPAGKPAEKPAEKPASEKGRPEQTLEIYDANEVPASLRSTLASLVRGLVVEELRGKEYDKLTTHKRETSIDLPTFRDPRQEKRHRLLSYEEQYQIKALLDGTPQIEILHMPYLENHVQRSSGRLIFVVQASVPVSGGVHYAIPRALAASTHFHFIAHLALTGEVCSRPSQAPKILSTPEIVEIHISLGKLEISNDLLNLGRKLIEDLINHELRRNEDRLRQQANDAIRKAFDSAQLHNPLLKFLGM
jgi:hypothetical protein